MLPPNPQPCVPADYRSILAEFSFDPSFWGYILDLNIPHDQLLFHNITHFAIIKSTSTRS